MALIVLRSVSQNIMCIGITWRSCKTKDSDAFGPGWGLGFCIPDELPGVHEAALILTTPGVAGVCRIGPTMMAMHA